MKIKSVIVLTFALFWSILLTAQVTTSGINGRITSTKGETLPGATVVAIHIPSNTLYGAISNDKGWYSIQGMRVGGPYKITISYVGFANTEFDNVQLSLGESSTYNASLKESSEQLGEVVITAVPGLRNTSGGAASNFKQSQIASTPTVDRNIYDVAKLSPLVSSTKIGGISIAGSNNRYNSFQIDGMVSNDVFGLAGSGTNGGQTSANPISLDAIQEIQVLISPFDVRQGGFTGGGINAITKSGTNQFHGSAFGYFTNQNMYGTWSQVKEEKIKLAEESTKTYGFTVGGPIIKDKLFFFASVENKFDTYPSDYYAGYKDGYISTAEAQAILDRYKSITGFDDSYGRRNLDTKGLSILGRLDWNVNKNNKFSFRYQLNDSYKDVYAAGSSTYYFANSGYRISDKTNSLVAELNSHLSNSLYNEARVGLTLVRDSRDVAYQAPNITIKNLGGVLTDTAGWTQGSTLAYIGTEYSSGANILNQDIYTIEDNLSWFLGNHTFTFGIHNEFYKMYNLFIQASNGAYYYNSLNDFLNDDAYQFSYNYSDYDLTGSYRWAATVQAGQLGFYAQDKWNISNNFDLTYGIRFDIPTFFNKPSTNDEFNESVYATTYNVKTGEVPSAKFMASPRLGFRWYTDDSHKTLVRGGTGLFTGRVPFVWLSNNWSNTGIEMKGTTISSNVPSFETYGNDAVAAMNSASGSASKPTINTVSKDFKYPQVFRSSLALEQILPGSIKVTLEGLYSKTMNNVWWENLALTDNGAKVYAVSSDVANSAATYWSRNTGSYYAIVNLKNTNKGYTYALSAKLEKTFDFGLDLMGSYTFGHAYSVNDGTSSVAYSNWKYNYAVNPNNADELSYSLFDVPNRILAAITYTTPKYLSNKLSTVVSLVYNGYNGQRYCLTYNESKDFNGDGQYGNSLLYVPTTDELAKMTFTSEEDRAGFESWIEADEYAKDHRGQYAERYSNSAPWENHFDLHLAEDFYYLNGKDGKVSLTFDILNIGNLLNKKWGANYSSYYNVQILKVTALTSDENGDKIPTYSFQGSEVSKSDFYSRWHAQVGLRVTF
jgi:hypothetical protein